MRNEKVDLFSRVVGITDYHVSHLMAVSSFVKLSNITGIFSGVDLVVVVISYVMDSSVTSIARIRHMVGISSRIGFLRDIRCLQLRRTRDYVRGEVCTELVRPILVIYIKHGSHYFVYIGYVIIASIMAVAYVCYSLDCSYIFLSIYPLTGNGIDRVDRKI